jgi:hypothetical protein
MNEQQRAELERIRDVLYPATGLEDYDEEIIGRVLKDIKALLAQDALDKKADNARELGLSYEGEIKTEVKEDGNGSFTITDAHSTADVVRWLLTQDTKETILCLIDEESQPAPVQEPFNHQQAASTALRKSMSRSAAIAKNTVPILQKRPQNCGTGYCSCIECVMEPAAQPAVHEGRDWSLLEATQESLREHMAEIKRLQKEIIEQCRIIAMGAEREDALRAEIKRLKAALPVPVQHDECVVCGDKVRVIPRPWVGLTETEVEAYDSWADFQVGCGRQTLFDMVRDIEAKLRERNT